MGNAESLLQHARDGNLDELKKIGDIDEVINTQNQKGWNAIICAAMNGHYDCVQFLIDNKADLNLQNKFSESALIKATMNGHFDVVKLLLLNGAKLNNNSIVLNNLPASVRAKLSSVVAEIEVQKLNAIDALKPKKHVMLSYSWAQKPLVKEMQQYLEQNGIITWRDEVGSPYVTKMEGNCLDVMAEAIESSSHFIVFISREYDTSHNCNLEFDYAMSLKASGDLKVIFVVMQPDFTPHSKPDRIKGSIRISMGAALYYTLFSSSDVNRVGKEILSVLD